MAQTIMAQNNTNEVLTKEELQNYNRRMLNLGAPVKWDFQGYNKVHFGPMMNLAQVQYLSDKQAAWIAKTLKRYTKTQLTEIASIIDATIAFYSNTAIPTAAIKVSAVNDDTVTIIWDFDKKIGVALKDKLDKTQYRWSKKDGQWLLSLNTSYVDTAAAAFDKAGINVTALLKAMNEGDKKKVKR